MDARGRTQRTDRIRQLKMLGWTNVRIGSEIGISAERVRQLLEREGSGLTDRELDGRQRDISRRLSEYAMVRDRLERRLAKVDRRVALASLERLRIQDEIDTRAIDRILELPTGGDQQSHRNRESRKQALNQGR